MPIEEIEPDDLHYILRTQRKQRIYVTIEPSIEDLPHERAGGQEQLEQLLRGPHGEQ